jgi:hypothetical protein
MTHGSHISFKPILTVWQILTGDRYLSDLVLGPGSRGKFFSARDRVCVIIRSGIFLTRDRYLSEFDSGPDPSTKFWDNMKVQLINNELLKGLHEKAV